MIGVSLMTIPNSAYSTYNKDLQESVEPMLDHVKTVSDSIQIATGVLSTLKISPEKMKASLEYVYLCVFHFQMQNTTNVTLHSPFMLATDIADYLVRKGVPFRETHHISGQCVAHSEKTGVAMNDMQFSDFQGIDKRFGEDIMEVFDYEHSVEMHSALGGTARKSVLEQIAILKDILK